MEVATALGLCCVGACALALYLYRILWLAPERVRRALWRQGVRGPPPSFPYGNLADMRQAAAAAKRTPSSRDDVVHDYRPAVFPFYEKWRNEYGTCVRAWCKDTSSLSLDLSIDLVRAAMDCD